MIATPGLTGRRIALSSLAVAMGLAMSVGAIGQASAVHEDGGTPALNPSKVNIGAAKSFAVLGDSTDTNTGPSTIGGDVGTSPGTSLTGFPPGVILAPYGLHVNTVSAAAAQTAAGAAYTVAANAATHNAGLTELGGLSLNQGVYGGGGVLGITGKLTLTGNASSVFIFKSTSTLITAATSEVVLDGVDACNVFWQVASSATLGADSKMVGTVMAQESITANNRASVEGRLLALGGAVTLQNNTINLPGCESTESASVDFTRLGSTDTPPHTSDEHDMIADTPADVPEVRELARTGTDVGLPIIAISTLLVGGVALLTLSGSTSRRRRGGRLSG